MHRRGFIKDTSKTAIAISVFGNIQWNHTHFIGDTPTTTDILGPFYRPGAPLRKNINPPGFSGELLHFSGTVLKEDGKTPVKNCLVEIWQCDRDQHYDNTSDDFIYRGAQKTDASGKYSFITTQPVAYPIEEGSSIYRPAHIHLRVAGEGQQDLITQIYFKGDSLLEHDGPASSPTAINRILTISNNDQDEKVLRFDIVLAKELIPADEVFKKLAGVYKMKDKSTTEFYREGDLMFVKWNGQITEALSYKDKNEFTGGVNNATTARFEITRDQKVRVTLHFYAVQDLTIKELTLEGVKTFKY
jgi:protocatechuate 3,4-dioxygenase beta subunit